MSAGRKQPLRFYPGQFNVGNCWQNLKAAKQAQKILNRYLKALEITVCDDDVPYPAPEREYRMFPTGKVTR